MTPTATAPVVSGKSVSLIPRWEASIDLASSKASSRERFYWTLIVQVGMEDILKPMHHGAFSGYLGRNEDSDLVSVTLASIRKDAMALDEHRRAIVMKKLVGHLMQRIGAF